MSTSLATNMRNTTDAFIKGWESWTTEAVLAVRAPECILIQLPGSLEIPIRNNEQFGAWFAKVEGSLSNNKLTVNDYFASTEERRAFVHCSMTADRDSGKKYEMEYFFALSFTETGEKITKILEMVDSQRVREAWEHTAEIEMKRD